MDEPETIIFDLDSTLAKRDGVALLEGVESWFAQHHAKRQHGESVPVVVIATNQGAPACHDAGWPFSWQFPPYELAIGRVGLIADFLGVDRVYTALAYRTKKGDWYQPNQNEDGTNKWEDSRSAFHAWRKPNSGMLIAAISDHNFTNTNALMVGDSDDDREAAEGAGVRFMHRDEFFTGKKAETPDDEIPF